MTQESWMNTGWRKDRPEFNQKKKRRRRKSKFDMQGNDNASCENQQGVSEHETSSHLMSVETIDDFDSLPKLTRALQVDDIFAYKIFEPGPNWVCQ